jgi:hypothetical protein
MSISLRDTPDLELALLRRGVHEMEAGNEHCRRCRRTPLIGEWVYAFESGAIVCELCRDVKRDAEAVARLMHGPEFGHTMRIIDQRAQRPRWTLGRGDGRRD